MPDHHVALGGGWMLWRDVELRSAGFPAPMIDALADELLAKRIDEGPKAALEDEAFAAARSDAQRRASEHLRAIARDPAFREAVTWQNRRAFNNSIDSLLRLPVTATDWRVRQKELLVVSYAQRYCSKNERAGFFGASTPARFVADGPALTVRPGPGLIASRSAYLEPWAIDALADQLSRDPELRAGLMPRRMPTIRLEGSTLVDASNRRNELPPGYAELIAACDGETPAQRIAERMVDSPGLDLGSVDEVFALLDDLVAHRIVLWTLEVPTRGGPPEQLLRTELARIAPSAARDRASAALSSLERGRDAVAAAGGSAEQVAHAIGDLERLFVSLTGLDSVRNPGEAYAGRTIVGLDCVRDVDVAIGPGVVARLAGPLELVLQSARWYTHEIAQRYRTALGAVYRELRGDGPAVVDYARFHARLPDLFPGPRAQDSIVAQVVTELHVRWREVLGLEGGERRVERSAEMLRPAVLRAFAAPGPGWPAARHHSPDVLLAANGIEAVNRGDFLAVLGEVHVGMNSLLVPGVPNAQGDPDAPFALRDRDVDRKCVAPVWSRRRSRVDYFSRSPGDFDLELAAPKSWRPRSQVLAIADLVLEEIDGSLIVRPRAGGPAFDVIAFLEHYLIGASFSEFSVHGSGHAPRVVVDGVVLVRERWVFPAAKLAFAHASDGARRFEAARAWARAEGLPRRVFLKVPEETKPVYLDLASPTLVELAAKFVRKASTVAISEMLPDLDDLWLVDAERKRYTSELRFVAVDPEPWVPA